VWIELVLMEKVSFGDGWEGRVIEGRFPLLKWLGGTKDSGLYLTVLQGLQEAVIQLISTNDAEGDAIIAQWDFAMSLSHPHVEPILARGRCVIEENELLYVISEPFSTNLAKTIASGTLDADQGRRIFNPIVEALSYLHENGVVHGHLNPSNIHFAGSDPKLSLTDLVIAGSVKRRISAPGNYDAPELWQGEASAAVDTWSLGMTMWEAMTGAPPSWDMWNDEEPEVPESLPSPFSEIVRESLHLVPTRRCTLRTIQDRLSVRRVTAFSAGSNPATNPARTDQAVIKGPLFDGAAPASTAIAASTVATMDHPAAHFSAHEEIETGTSSEPALFSGTLTHFEEEHLHRSWVMPYAGVLLAVIAIGAVLYVREHKSGASPTATGNAAAISAPAVEKQAPPPATPAPQQTEPAQTESATTGPTQKEPALTGTAQTEPATSAAASQARDSQQAQDNDASKEQAKDAPRAAAQPAQRSGTGQDRTGQDKTGQAEAHTAAAVNQPDPEPSSSADRERTNENARGLVEKRVMPTVSPGARGSMRRPIEVRIRVSVNQEGRVSDAAYVAPGPGNYFARAAQRAALGWKFKPPVQNGDRERSVWMLRFNFARAGIEATATEQGR
jgi:TonB family protein